MQSDSRADSAGTSTYTFLLLSATSRHPVASVPQAHQAEARWKLSSGDEPGCEARAQENPRRRSGTGSSARVQKPTDLSARPADDGAVPPRGPLLVAGGRDPIVGHKPLHIGPHGVLRKQCRNSCSTLRHPSAAMSIDPKRPRASPVPPCGRSPTDSAVSGRLRARFTRPLNVAARSCCTWAFNRLLSAASAWFARFSSSLTRSCSVAASTKGRPRHPRGRSHATAADQVRR